MRTIKGFEAISLAEEHDIPLYDLYLKNELNVEEAKQFVDSRRDPDTFAVFNWPDTHDEADAIVLSAYEVAFEEGLMDANLEQIMDRTHMWQLHSVATELAAERLVERQLLEVDFVNRDYPIYRLARTYYFRRPLIASITTGMCEKCVESGVEGPFHKVCLERLLANLHASTFSVDAVAYTDTRSLSESRHHGAITERLRPRLGLLSKTMSDTKARWQSVLKPILNRGSEEDTVSKQADRHEEPEQLALPQRSTMTKSELIAYLQSIDIVDDLGEVERMKKERIDLQHRLDTTEQHIYALEKERDYWKDQFDALSHDMQKMADAMEIAQRHTSRSVQVSQSSTEDGRSSKAFID